MILFIIVSAILLVFLSWLMLGILSKSLIKKNIVDAPNERTLHAGSVPRGGGLVIIGMLITTLIIMAIVSQQWMFFGVLSFLVSAWAMLSWYDDKHDLSPWFRFSVQFCIAVLTVFSYGWVNSVLSLPLNWFGPFVSVIGIMWLANLYNFMDGMDGLAGSQAVIASITLSFWFFNSGAVYLALVCLILAAASYGFVLRNWHPAQIFMGDVGSITLGAFFASLIIIGVTRFDIPVVSFLCLFSIFITDSTSTIIIRSCRKEKIWLPHRQHLYQRLATAGYSHSQIVIWAIVLMTLCSFIATLGVLYRDMIILSIFSTVLLLIVTSLAAIALEKKGLKRQQLNQES